MYIRMSYAYNFLVLFYSSRDSQLQALSGNPNDSEAKPPCRFFRSGIPIENGAILSSLKPEST